MEHTTAGAEGSQLRRPGRLASLDVFRGFVILSMVFVNYLPGMPGIPGWLLHAPADFDGFTPTDVVFPGFLFIVGVAIPLAAEKRLREGFSRWRVFRHALIRSAALIFLGVIMVNSSRYSSAAWLSQPLWYLLVYVCVIVLWMRMPEGPGRWRWIVKGTAALVLAGLLLLFRADGADGSSVWLTTSWWGILGIIGWAYLTCVAAYLACRGNSTVLMGILGLMIALFIGDRHGVLSFLGPVRDWLNVGQLLGSHPAIVTAGMIVGLQIPRPGKSDEGTWSLGGLTGFGVALLAGGILLRPLHGISKIGGTDSYALVTAGICCLFFLVFFGVIDHGGLRSGWGLLKVAGTNPLLAYLLPDVLGNLMELTGTWGWFWPLWSQGGLPGLLNALGMTLVVLALTWYLTRRGVVIRL